MGYFCCISINVSIVLHVCISTEIPICINRDSRCAIDLQLDVINIVKLGNIWNLYEEIMVST